VGKKSVGMVFLSFHNPKDVVSVSQASIPSSYTSHSPLLYVIPAKAGIHTGQTCLPQAGWIPDRVGNDVCESTGMRYVGGGHGNDDGGGMGGFVKLK
jgi:hypothetical protein